MLEVALMYKSVFSWLQQHEPQYKSLPSDEDRGVGFGSHNGGVFEIILHVNGDVFGYKIFNC